MLGDDSLNVDSDRDMCMGSSCESPRPPLLAARAPSALSWRRDCAYDEYARDLTGGWRLTAGGGDLEQLEDDFKGWEPTAEFNFKWRA